MNTPEPPGPCAHKKREQAESELAAIKAFTAEYAETVWWCANHDANLQHGELFSNVAEYGVGRTMFSVVLLNRPDDLGIVVFHDETPSGALRKAKESPAGQYTGPTLKEKLENRDIEIAELNAIIATAKAENEGLETDCKNLGSMMDKLRLAHAEECKQFIATSKEHVCNLSSLLEQLATITAARDEAEHMATQAIQDKDTFRAAVLVANDNCARWEKALASALAQVQRLRAELVSFKAQEMYGIFQAAANYKPMEECIKRAEEQLDLASTPEQSAVKASNPTNL